MSDSEHLREQAAKAQRLARSVGDKVTTERLTLLADEYLARADELESSQSPASEDN